NMGTRKGLRITSTDFNEPSEDIFEDHGDYETENHHTGPMANRNKKNKTLAVEGNEYEKIRQLTIRENQKRLEQLGVKNIVRRKRLRITSTISNEHIEEHVDNDHVEDDFEDHQNFKTQGAPKKVRGYTQKSETWKMNSSNRIVVTFNKLRKPIGDEGSELVQFLGTLVRNSDHVSIEYSDWRKSKFVIYPNETNEIKSWIFESLGTKLRTWKGSLKERAYDPSLCVDEIVAKHVKNDNRLNAIQFKELVG
ncbi:hypothetical protein M8C21_014504, partial [Ambrosia artemisiifolia]